MQKPAVDPDIRFFLRSISKVDIQEQERLTGVWGTF